MAIKWKDKLLLPVWLLLLTFGLNGVLWVSADGNEYLRKSYFQSQQFEYQLNDFVDILSTYDLYYLTGAEMKAKITVSENEINDYRYRYGDLESQLNDIRNQYTDRISQAEQNKDSELTAAYTTERDTKLEDIRNNFLSNDHVRAKIVKEKEQAIDAYLNELEKSRSRFENSKTEFKYYLRDTTSGEVYTNLNLQASEEVSESFNKETMLTVRDYATIRGGNEYTYRGYYGRSNVASTYNGDIQEILSLNERRFEGQIGVPVASPSTSTVWQNYQNYGQTRLFTGFYSLVAIAALVACWFLYKKTRVTRNISWEKLRLLFNRIPIDVRMAGFALSSLITVLLLCSQPALYLTERFLNRVGDGLIESIALTVLTTLVIIQGNLWYEKIKRPAGLKDEWERSLIKRVHRGIKGAFLNRSMGTQMFLLLAVCFTFGMGTVAILVEEEILAVYIPAFILIGLPTLWAVIKRTGYFNQILSNTNEIVQGIPAKDLAIKGKSPLATLAGNVNTLKNGVKVSQREQAKSERLKTELITNVSHDLRTPLTSIITYSELLKNQELTPEDREAYVQIIDRKAKRLKILIDDLFEASKMASGNVELNKEKVDLVQLIQQGLAEHNEEIDNSGLSFRVSTPEKPVYAYVDGQKLWRAFDNLIGNILKYSLENTRVYISLRVSNGKAKIEFKNVTKYELGENTDELFERFKRGDTSRHTEGSGLGLAIAKSIVDLHDGDMDIEIDGDLFKISITLNILVS